MAANKLNTRYVTALAVANAPCYRGFMYLMYVDESGDTGLVNSPTRYFGLSGLTVHESQWRTLAAQITAFRRTMKFTYGPPLRREIHAAEYLRHPPVAGMAKHTRLAILRNFLDEIAKMNFISITNVIVDKQNKPPTYDVFDQAWRVLFQRFENTIGYGNFPGGHKTDTGMVLTDNTDGRKLTKLVRKMSVYNPIPNAGGPGVKMMPLVRVIEDPHPKDSVDSYFIQAFDICAYFLMQKYMPNSYVRKSSAQHYLNRLAPVLNTRASRSNGQGIVVL